MFIGVYNLPGIVTFVGLWSSITACFLAFNNHIKFAVILFMFSGICDLFDGVVARKVQLCESEKLFGVQIDSIVDIVSFGITPVIIKLGMGNNGFVDYAIMGIYVACAAMRLAYFNITVAGNDKPIKFYKGLPVTFAAIIFPIAYFMEYFMSIQMFEVWVKIVFLLLSILFILKINIPKPKGVFYIVFPMMFIIMIIVWGYLPGVLR